MGLNMFTSDLKLLKRGFGSRCQVGWSLWDSSK